MERNPDGASDVVLFEFRHACIVLRILQELEVGFIPELVSETCLTRGVVDKEIAASYWLGFRYIRSSVTVCYSSAPGGSQRITLYIAAMQHMSVF